MILTLKTRLSTKTLIAVAASALTLSAASAQPLVNQPLINQTAALQPRITAPIDNAHRVTLTGSRSPLANPAADIGPVPADMKLTGISLNFSRSAAQQQDLDALIAAQQTPGSPLFHQWLTPDQFAARFGVADADIAATENWLQLQGFSIDAVNRSHNRITFSGTAALVASAFGSPLHYFKSTSAAGVATTHFAPANDLTIPSALASSVLAIGNLSNFRPHPHLKHAPAATVAAASVRPNFTSSQSGNHFITPGDLATIYDITPAYNAGFTGANQSIAVLGQSAVLLSDIAAFQNAINIPAKTPELVLVPSTGASTIYQGDEGESDLDLEYTSTIAKSAQVFFVYTGDTSNNGVFDSLAYAVDERIAPIISISYGDCETDFGASHYTTYNTILAQAAAQGQSVIAAAGDDGSTDCYGITDLTTAQQEAVIADFPSTSQYVTGLGGTEFPTADVVAGNNTYFTAQGSTDVISSALSYIPEGVWNDDATFAADDPSSPLGAGGGGVSIFTAHPIWQTGTIGGVAIPTSAFRLTPDISLTASPINAPLAYCTSDTSSWVTGQVSSCTEGLRDASTGDLTVAGGTSFDAPTFSGMLALIEQAVNSTGEGVINPTLYTLAANATTYASAFHDITSGGNQCLSGAAYCTSPGTTDYAAVTGYDQASGLGSIDLYHLLTAWPTTAASALLSSTTTLAAATTTPVVSTSDVITIAVAPTTTSTAVPTGTVALIIDGAPATAATTLTLVNGVITYTFSSAITGSHIINATYSGDATFAPSTASISISIGVTQVGTFAISAGNISVASGSSAATTVTVTPAGGYTGTVNLGLNLPDSLLDVCATDTNNGSIVITGTAAGTDVVTIYTSTAVCNSLGLSTAVKIGKGGARILPITHRGSKISLSSPHRSPWKQLPLPTAIAGAVLLFGLRRRRNSKLLRAGLSLAVFAMISISGLGLVACSNNSSATVVGTSGDTPAGTYVVQIVGTDALTLVTSTANVTLTVN